MLAQLAVPRIAHGSRLYVSPVNTTGAYKHFTIYHRVDPAACKCSTALMGIGSKERCCAKADWDQCSKDQGGEAGSAHQTPVALLTPWLLAEVCIWSSAKIWCMKRHVGRHV